jgi:Tfp pilus assembly protein PilX
MKSPFNSSSRRAQIFTQRGVVLFFALIALVAMSLAAVALIRSVDTGTMIAGNLAFKQSATSAGDAGIDAAINWLTIVRDTNSGLNVVTNNAHPFNITSAATGYYSNFNPALSLTDGNGIQWNNNDSAPVNPDANGNPTPDSGGNSSRYVIQRMCRIANTAIQNANCLLSEAIIEGDAENIKLPQDWCPLSNPGCPVPGQTPQIRITTRTVGPRNTVSYVQVFVY